MGLGVSGLNGFLVMEVIVKLCAKVINEDRHGERSVAICLLLLPRPVYLQYFFSTSGNCFLAKTLFLRIKYRIMAVKIIVTPLAMMMGQFTRRIP